ncbi:hypothetical protein ACQI4L_26205 [Mycolicibacterium litorale]|uniref:hypothetical protein n=1 Tax=Mycolicibacterium litorale TaxID=758802 RepID=UPI003CF981AA
MNKELLAEVEHDCLLYAHRSGSDVWVYRSAIVGDDDDLYCPVLELIDGAELVHRESVADAGMVFGQAEVSLYRAAA